jgi:hypothetical protein
LIVLVASRWLPSSQQWIQRDLSLGFLMFTALQCDAEFCDPLMAIWLGEPGPQTGAM